MATTRIFIDSRVNDQNLLISQFAPGTPYQLLDARLDGIEQIATALAGEGGYDSIQIISHGAPGSITLGSSVLDVGTLAAYAGQLTTIGHALTENGDLLLYGCNVAAGDAGQQFVNTLSALTGADVAASDDVTGSAALGGDWVQEVRSGTIDGGNIQTFNLDGTLETANTINGSIFEDYIDADVWGIANNALSTNDSIYGDRSNDTIDGGLGNDTAKYEQSYTNYTITRNPNLNPVISPNANTSYDFDIDSVCVTQLSSTYYYDDPPVLTSSTPSDNATAVAIGSDIVLGFSGAVQAGVGNIVISNGSDIRTISVTDSQVTIYGSTVTINPVNDLQAGSTYNVQLLPGVIKEMAGNSYACISDATTLNLGTNTAPVLTEFTESGNQDATITFTSTAFSSHFADLDGDGLSTIKVTSLPGHGTLKLWEVDVILNQEISSANLANLSYGPNANWHGSDNYGWQASDGKAYSAASAMVNLTVIDPSPSPNQDLTGNITFWKSATPITGVTSTLTSVSAVTSTQPIEFRNIHVAADGSRTIEIWETSSKSDIGSVDLEFTLSTGSVTTWRDATGLPSGWTSVANTENPGKFILGGMGITALSSGSVQLGTLTLTAPTNQQHFELLLSSGQLGNDTVPTFGIASDSMTAGADGLYQHIDMPDGTYALTCAKISGTAESNAIKANDALAALKIAVALNPNSDGSAVLPYQYLAADVNKDGVVKAADALNILKMAVKLSTAPEKEWLFVPESVASETMSRTNVLWPDNPIPVTLDVDQDLHLIGIVKGDVNGSWAA